MRFREQPLQTRKSATKQALFVTLSCVLVSGIGLLSFLPYADKAALHTRGRFHSLGHLLIFSLLGYVAVGVSSARRTRIILVAAALAFSFGIELAEGLVYHTSVEWDDVAVDCAGVVAGLLIAILFAPKMRLRDLE